jgi:hypothetical protein
MEMLSKEELKGAPTTSASEAGNEMDFSDERKKEVLPFSRRLHRG